MKQSVYFVANYSSVTIRNKNSCSFCSSTIAPYVISTCTCSAFFSNLSHNFPSLTNNNIRRLPGCPLINSKCSIPLDQEFDEAPVVLSPVTVTLKWNPSIFWVASGNPQSAPQSPTSSRALMLSFSLQLYYKHPPWWLSV